jgi:hypothetical protein
VPDWARERQGLWNQVELKEDQSKHADTAQLARDFKVTLPHELNAEQRRWMVTDFCRELSRRGMVIDAAIHAPDAGSDDRNVHVHMLVTMRSIGPEGFGNKVREWNNREEYQRWTERWSELGAKQLERAGFKQEAERFRHGHLSRPQQIKLAKERGDDEHYQKLLNEKNEHLGPQANALKDKGVDLRIEQRNRNRAEIYFGKIDIPRDMREAYALSADAGDFPKKLSEKGMSIACVTRDEARDSRIENRDAKTEGKYLPSYREGEIVVVTDRAQVYRLTEQTTGDNWKNIRAFNQKFKDQDVRSLTEVREAVMELARVHDLERQAHRDLAAIGVLSPDKTGPGPAHYVRKGLERVGQAEDAIGRAAASVPRRVRQASRALGVLSIFDSAYTPEERKAFAARFEAKQKVNAAVQKVEKTKNKKKDRDHGLER